VKLIPAVEKFKGTLLGCACGDALGAPIEGMPQMLIRKRYGVVKDFLDERFGTGKITDDTQMTVCLAQSIIEFGRFERDHAAYRFAVWMENSDKKIKEARGVGMACATACRRLYKGESPDKSGVDSAGCGAAMRASPIGLRYFNDPEMLKKTSIEQALITHKNSKAVAGAVAVAYSVALGIKDFGNLDKEWFIDEISKITSDIDSEFSRKIRGLSKCLDSPIEEGFAYTGNGGYVMETVPGALLSFLYKPYDLEEAIINSVNAGGDTDSLGAITGAISGAFNGIEKIPDRWKENVEGRSYIEGLAEKLYTLSPAYQHKTRTLI